ncbi:MAG: hypothetical protein IKP65_07585 [Alphaproteobacteria bacterium]|nr:hypothetical protein [Alphaproteobacteria bacterium]
MKKNGIQFNFQKSKQEEECFICSKKIDKGNDEYISEITPTMHLCNECAINKVCIPGKKGATAKYKNRVYMWVEKGVKGNHTCDLTGQEIKNGTPCWWSAKKDDPNNKTASYVISFDSIKEPNEFDENEIKSDDVEPWYDENYKSISEIHMEKDVNSFFEQIYGKDFFNNDVKLIYHYDIHPAITIQEYVNELMNENKNKKYFVFWKGKDVLNNTIIKVINNERIKKVIKGIGKENSEKPIEEIVISIPEIYCDIYEKNENNNWNRID